MANKVWKNYFESLNQIARCQLIVEMIRNMNFREKMKMIGLRSSENNSERTIVINLLHVYQAIGSTSHSKDANVT